jgi:L-fuconolactonase
VTPIFDSHVHAWNAWPYPDVPVRPASGEALLAELGRHGASRALIVCADIDRSADNNTYVAGLVRETPDELAYAIDSDSIWSVYHHTNGAAGRLEALADTFPDAVAVTHYVDPVPDGWFDSLAGREWLGVVASRYGVLSLSAHPGWTPIVRDIAQTHDLTILWHHLAGTHAGRRDQARDVAAAAADPNVVLKLSGFHYVSAEPSGPWDDVLPLLDDLYAAFGPRRMCWGSDWPASQRYTDYGTSLAAAAAWLDRLDVPERTAILGGNLQSILERKGR